MNDMSAAIQPKSDQLNADDLIGGPRTITITGVTVHPGEQPVSIAFEGDNGKPYKPCKSMCRVLASMWGLDPRKYVGRAMTLYLDPSVKYGGIAVGGVRISHLSHIERAADLALTVTRGKRAPYTVKPLTNSSPAAPSLAGDEGAPAATPPAAGAFRFTMTSLRGETKTTEDGAQWSAALVALFESRSFDLCKRAWTDNKAHVEAAYDAEQGTFARAVEAAWRKRERTAADVARGG